MKKIINKIIISLWLFITWLSMCPNFIYAQDNNCNRRWWDCHVKDINTVHTERHPDSTLLDVIKNAINWCLGILATVVLCFCIYWWFQMLTSWADSKWYDAWWKILKNALIWLAIILLAWMIVSVIFRFVAAMSSWNQTQSTDVTPV